MGAQSLADCLMEFGGCRSASEKMLAIDRLIHALHETIRDAPASPATQGHRYADYPPSILEKVRRFEGASAQGDVVMRLEQRRADARMGGVNSAAPHEGVQYCNKSPAGPGSLWSSSTWEAESATSGCIVDLGAGRTRKGRKVLNVH